jgi:hypothetical protein
VESYSVMLGIPHCLDNWLRDDGEVSLKRRPRSSPQKHFISACGSNFSYRIGKPHDLVRPEGLGKLIKIIHLIGAQTHDIPVRFEVFTAVTMKNGVFWVVTPCGSCKNRRFGGTWQPSNRRTLRRNTKYFFAAYVGC